MLYADNERERERVREFSPIHQAGEISASGDQAKAIIWRHSNLTRLIADSLSSDTSRTPCTGGGYQTKLQGPIGPTTEI